jgi:hypothetical protein
MYMKENKNVLVSLFEGATGGGREKENVREWKMLKQPIYIWTWYNALYSKLLNIKGAWW